MTKRDRQTARLFLILAVVAAMALVAVHGTDSFWGRAGFVEADHPRLALKLEKGGAYVLRAAGTDRFGQGIEGECRLSVSDNDDTTKLRFFAEAATLRVGEEAKVRLHSRLAGGLALLGVSAPDSM